MAVLKCSWRWKKGLYAMQKRIISLINHVNAYLFERVKYLSLEKKKRIILQPRGQGSIWLRYENRNCTLRLFKGVCKWRRPGRERPEKLARDLKIGSRPAVTSIDPSWMHSRPTACKSLPITGSGAPLYPRVGRVFISVSFPDQQRSSRWRSLRGHARSSRC